VDRRSFLSHAPPPQSASVTSPAGLLDLSDRMSVATVPWGIRGHAACSGEQPNRVRAVTLRRCRSP
jgi:hypothetical protein